VTIALASAFLKLIEYMAALGTDSLAVMYQIAVG
jgi:hypothetical protein